MAIGTNSTEVEAADIDTIRDNPYRTRTERKTEHIDGVCTLIWDATYEKRQCGWMFTERTLDAITVDDYDAARAELQRRGIGVGALYHKTTEEV